MVEQERFVYLTRKVLGTFLLLYCLQAPAFELVEQDKPAVGDVIETEWQRGVDPGTPFDRIGLHRYQNPTQETVAALYYLPGTNMNGELTITDENHNLWLYLANRGIQVFALDYRTHFTSHEMQDVTHMKNWTLSSFVDDADLASEHIRELLPETPLFVAGFSRGVSYAYALAGRQEFAGLIALDGGFKSATQSGFDIGPALQRFDQRRDYASVLSRRGYEARRELMLRVLNDPEGPAMKEQYETVADELADTLHRAWGPGGLANTRDDISPIGVLARHLIDYDWYFPAIQSIEGRSIAAQNDDPHTTLDDHFGSMTLPLLYFGATGMGGRAVLNGIYSAVNSGSKDVTLNLLEGFGHNDVLVARSAPVRVYNVIYEWMVERSARPKEID